MKQNRITTVQDLGVSPHSGKPLVMGSTVFNEDCMTVMARYPDKYFDLAICDPPYGIGMDGDFSCFSKNDKGFLGKRNHKQKDWDSVKPAPEYFTELRRVSKNQIIFGANYFTEFLPSSMGWIVWDKKVANANNKNFSDCELAYTSFEKRLVKLTYDWIGFGYLNNKAGQVKIHPTEKPIDLYRMILKEYAKPNDLIFDSHLGSGSSRIACHKEGLEFVGCEIDAEYFAAQEARFLEFTSQLRLFG